MTIDSASLEDDRPVVESTRLHEEIDYVAGILEDAVLKDFSSDKTDSENLEVLDTAVNKAKHLILKIRQYKMLGYFK